MLVSHKIPHLLGGVSQLAPELRGEYHVEQMDNMLPHASLGLIRRPPSQHVSAVPLVPGSSVLFHEFVLQSVRYLVAVSSGDLKVYNALTGAEVSCSFPNGKAYLNGTIRAVNAGDKVILANTSVVVEKDTTVAPTPSKVAVVWVRSADFGTKYNVTVNGTTYTHTTVTSTAPADKLNVTTTVIANGLLTQLAGLGGAFSLTVVGSYLIIRRTDGADFTISTDDGQGDNGLRVVKDTVRSVSDLPEKALDGMVVKVTGDPSSAVDDYYVKYTAGVWNECAQPGTLISLKKSTMPWALTLSSGISYQSLGAHTQLADFTKSTVVDNSLGFPRNADVTLTVPSQAYPAGTLVHLVVQGVTYDYIAVGGETNSSIVTALAALIPASTTDYTLSAGGAVLDFAAQPSKSLNIFASITLPANRFYNPSLALVPGAFATYSLLNTTTGASGTISTNTADVVTLTGPLTGGTRNTLLPGDVCEVSAPGGSTLVCAPLTWKDRAAGDLTVVPFPSFVGKSIDEVYFSQGRLGISAGESNVLSAAGDILQFFRKSATALLPDDMIDVRQASREAARFHSAAIWRNAVYLFTERGAHALTGTPVLTPTTVRIDPTGQFLSYPIRPANAGESLFVARSAQGFTRVAEMVVVPNTENRTTTSDASDHVATYMPGTPRFIVGDGSTGTVVLGTTSDLSSIFVYSFMLQQDGTTVGAWGRWTFPGATILGAVHSAGELLLLVSRADGVMIERVSVSNPMAITDYRDRQGLAGSEVLYTSMVALHTLFPRDRNNIVDTSGLLTIRKLHLFHTLPSAYSVGVFATARAAVATFSDPTDNDTVVYVGARNTEVDITIAASAASPMRLTSLEWTGSYTNWARRT